MIRNLLSCLILLLSAVSVNAQNDTLRIEVSGIKLKELTMNIDARGFDDYIVVEGERCNDTWTFPLADTIRPIIKSINMFGEETDSMVQLFFFNSVFEGDTITTTSIQGLSPGVTLKCRFMHESIDEKHPFVGYRDAHVITFFVENTDPEFVIYNYIDNNKKRAKTERMEIYRNMISKYPGSSALMSKLYSEIYYDYTKEELSELWNLFDSNVRSGYYGNIVRNYLDTELGENPVLTNSATGAEEAMLLDTTKYNLVIFSASWCGPCHALMPLLKDIYADLHSKGLAMTYVSSDRASGVEAWKKLMKEKEIPWRSLLVLDKREAIDNKYSVKYIPYSLLFSPDGSYEVINVRKPEDKEKLYKLFE